MNKNNHNLFYTGCMNKCIYYLNKFDIALNVAKRLKVWSFFTNMDCWGTDVVEKILKFKLFTIHIRKH